MAKVIRPNVVRGGKAIPLGNNYYYMQGRKHSQGGIDIGPNDNNGLEVEGGEVMKVSPKSIKVYSSVPFLHGKSPAELVMGGANPTKVFDAQEEFKDRNNIKDDGTKAIFGLEKLAKRAKRAVFGPDFSGITTTGGRNYNVDDIKTVYNRIKRSNLKPEQQATILAAVIEESGGNPYALGSAGEQGIFQFKSDRYPNNYKNKEDRKGYINDQVDYMLNTINNLDDQISWTHGGTGSGYKSRTDAYNDFNSDDLETVNRGFNLGYIRPSGKINSANNRFKVAQQVLERIKKYGGNMSIITLNNNGKTRLIYTPSTGRNRKPIGGIYNPYTDGPYKSFIDKVNENPPIIKGVYRTNGSNNNTENNTDYDALTTNDWIGLGTDAAKLLTGIGSYISTANKINHRKDVPNLIPLQSRKLKTTVNINPQLDDIRERKFQSYRDSNESASSQTRAARRGIARTIAGRETNQLYGWKENIETQLTNQDRGNQQTVANQNIAAQNERNRLQQAEVNNRLALRIANSEQFANGVDNFLTQLNDRRDQRRYMNNAYAATFAKNPDVTPDLLRSYGYTPYGRLLRRRANNNTKNE